MFSPPHIHISFMSFSLMTIRLIQAILVANITNILRLLKPQDRLSSTPTSATDRSLRHPTSTSITILTLSILSFKTHSLWLTVFFIDHKVLSMLPPRSHLSSPRDLKKDPVRTCHHSSRCLCPRII